MKKIFSIVSVAVTMVSTCYSAGSGRVELFNPKPAKQTYRTTHIQDTFAKDKDGDVIMHKARRLDPHEITDPMPKWPVQQKVVSTSGVHDRHNAARVVQLLADLDALEQAGVLNGYEEEEE